MLELVVAAAGPGEHPAVVSEQAQDVADSHGRSVHVAGATVQSLTSRGRRADPPAQSHAHKASPAA